MSAEARVGSRIPSASRSRPARRTDRRYFLVVSVLIAVLVFVGFAESYYLRSVFGSAPLPWMLHVHGAAMTSWVVLVVTQVLLVAAKKVEWHRRVGWAAVASATLVVVLGTVTTVRAAARELANHTAHAASQLTILGLELTQMLLFGSLFAAAIALRRRTDHHKRLMLLATACLLPSPLVRLPLGVSTNFAILLIFDALVLAAIAADTIRGRRLHPAYAYGGLWLLGGLQVAYVIAYTPAWHRAAAWLVS